jgi:hypothetical protein
MWRQVQLQTCKQLTAASENAIANVMTHMSSWHLTVAWGHDSCLCGLQQALNVTDRVYSVSSDTVAPCGQQQVACTQIAPMAEMLNDTDYLDTELLPYVDGIITSTPNASISPLFAFSASTDPGLLFLLPFVLHRTVTHEALLG